MLDDQRAALFTCYHRTSRSSETKEGDNDEKKEEDNSFNEQKDTLKYDVLYRIRSFQKSSAKTSEHSRWNIAW